MSVPIACIGRGLIVLLTVVLIAASGPVTVRRPRVRDRQPDGKGGRIRFTSSILPPYLRRARAVEELLPWLYLKGISTNDFGEALAALLGPEAPGLSASTIARQRCSRHCHGSSSACPSSPESTLDMVSLLMVAVVIPPNGISRAGRC